MSHSQPIAGKWQLDRRNPLRPSLNSFPVGQIRPCCCQTLERQHARFTKVDYVARGVKSFNRRLNSFPKQPKDDRFKTVQQLEKMFIRRNGLEGTFADPVDYVDLSTGEIRTFPKYASYHIIFDAFKVKQKNGFYAAGHIFKLEDYLGLDEDV